MKVEAKTKPVVAEAKRPQIMALISGVAMAYALTCLVFIAYSILITYSSVTTAKLPLVVTITSLAAVILAGFDAAKGAENKGWLWGIFAGVIYAVILVAIGYWLNKGFTLDARTITLLVLAVAGGGLGGVIGINLKRK